MFRKSPHSNRISSLKSTLKVVFATFFLSLVASKSVFAETTELRLNVLAPGSDPSEQIPVPDTGFASVSDSGISLSIIAIILAVVLAAVVAFVFFYLHRRRQQKDLKQAENKVYTLDRKPVSEAVSDSVKKAGPRATLALVGLLTAGLAMSMFQPAQPAKADAFNQDDKIGITTGGSLPLNAVLDETLGAFIYTTDHVSVNGATNNGYDLYMTSSRTGSGGNYLYLNGDATSEHFLLPTDGSRSVPGVLEDNAWGYTISSNNPSASDSVWIAVPTTEDGHQLREASGSATPAGDSINVTYGFKVSADATLGTYLGSVTYTAIANYLPYTLTLQTQNDTTLTVTRTASPRGGNLGILASGDTILHGDTLSIAATSPIGFSTPIIKINGEVAAEGTYTVVGNTTIVSSANVQDFRLTTSAGNGVTIGVTRTSSPYGNASTGPLTNGDKLYYHDVIQITFTPVESYNIVLHTVNGESFTSGELLTVERDISVRATASTITYNITYSCNGATGNPEVQVKEHNQPVNLYAETVCSNPGYSFLEWNTAADGSGDSYSAGSSYTENAELTLYAKWGIIGYPLKATVGTYTHLTIERLESPYGNASTGVIVPPTVVYHGDVLRITATVDTGYDAPEITYSTTNNSNDFHPLESDTYTINNSPLYLKVKTNVVEYNITYNCNGGSGGVPAQFKVTNESIVIADNDPNAGGCVNENGVFNTWNTSSDGTGVDYDPGTTYSDNADLTLYAKWDMIVVYTLKYNNNGGEGETPADEPSSEETSARTYTFTNLQEAVIPYRENYSFRGWATNPNAVEPEAVPGGEFVARNASHDVTLYAVWQAVVGFPSSLTTMQDMTDSICDAVTTPTKWDISLGEEYSFTVGQDTKTEIIPDMSKVYGVQMKSLTDTRDTKTYTIAKLADGRCWMTQNLALGGSSSITLTPANSDVSSNFTIPAAQNTGSTDWSQNVDTLHIYQNAETYYGNYYNWYTATAGTGTASLEENAVAQDSICPKGWNLPSRAEQRTLVDSYKLNYTGGADIAANAPIYLVKSGQYLSGESIKGVVGYYWSSTAKNQPQGYVMVLGGTNVEVTGWNKFFGYSVRCVATSN